MIAVANISFQSLVALGCISLITVVVLTPLMRTIAIRLNIIDVPSESHKTHSHPIPYLGGVAIILGVNLVTYASLVSNYTADTIILASTILVPATIMGIVGLVDDIRKLLPWPRFLIQTFFGMGISCFLVITNTLGSPFGNSWLDISLTALWIVGITNAINFFDNLDGGASGAMFITSSFLFFLSWQGGQILIAAMSLVLAGASLGFYIWNKPPARIYMGDAGALFLGVLVASLTTRFNPNPIDKFASFSIPLLILAVPILDTCVAVISRVFRGVSPFQGGKDHLSHRLIRLGYSKQKTLNILLLLCAFFSLFAVAISYSSFASERTLMYSALLFWLTSFFYFFRIKTLPN